MSKQNSKVHPVHEKKMKKDQKEHTFVVKKTGHDWKIETWSEKSRKDCKLKRNPTMENKTQKSWWKITANTKDITKIKEEGEEEPYKKI